MNRQNLNSRKKIRSQSHFPACKTPAVLLKTKYKTAERPCRSGKILSSPACSSIDQKRQSPKAGDLLLRWVGGSRCPIDCGIEASEPQDTGFDKIEEFIALETIG
jgi:hypothetical protein